MRIIDKNTDFYDYWQSVYRDSSVTFDRTDSFLLTKEIMCKHLHISRYRFTKECELLNFVLLQIGNVFWLFLAEVTKSTDYGVPTDYKIELLKTWKNYDKPRCPIKLDVIRFGYAVQNAIYQDRHWNLYDKGKIIRRADTLAKAIDQNDFDVLSSINKHTIYKSGRDYNSIPIEKHIPLLKACGIADCVDPLEVFLAFEEYFSLEKSATERTESVGLTDEEKIGNHGFDLKTSFRSKT